MDDYELFLKENNLNKEQIKLASEVNKDRLYILDDRIEIKDSDIEGLGVHTVKSITKNTYLLALYKSVMRTDLGRYTNHSANNNCRPIYDYTTKHTYFVPNRDIKVGEELTLCYREYLKLTETIRG